MEISWGFSLRTFRFLFNVYGRLKTANDLNSTVCRKRLYKNVYSKLQFNSQITQTSTAVYNVVSYSRRRSALEI